MIEKFPSKGTSVLVTKDMCDLNNHMNVVYYQHIFEDGCHNSVSYTHLTLPTTPYV